MVNTFAALHKGTQFRHVHLGSLDFGWHDFDQKICSKELGEKLRRIVVAEMAGCEGEENGCPGQNAEFDPGISQSEERSGVEWTV